MPGWIEPVTLEGEHVVLEPLARSHVEALARAAADGELWRLWYTSVPSPERTQAYVDAALAMRENEGALPFVVRRRVDGTIIGTTRFFHVEPAHRRLELGHTWYAASAQRSAVNAECKLLLLGHAFEALGAVAVELRTHFLNHASRRAIERLGAKLDGVLRHHMTMPNGTLRDTCVYSILAAEWPAVRENLKLRLALRGGERRC
ncbi:MAG TPA: GNAT family protein [Zeimonas sp.]